MNQATLTMVDIEPGETESKVVFDLRITFDAKAGRGPIPPGFDPWTAEISPAKLPDFETPAGCQTYVAATINRCRTAIEEGEAVTLLNCLAWTIEHGMVPPEWLADAFLTKFKRFTEDEFTLDDAFGLPRQVEQGRRTSVNWKHLRPKVMSRLYEELGKDEKLRIDNDLYERVGEALGIGKEKCRLIAGEAVREYGFQSLKELKRFHKQIRKLRPKSKTAG
jgi:hypothetical protein